MSVPKERNRELPPTDESFADDSWMDHPVSPISQGGRVRLANHIVEDLDADPNFYDLNLADQAAVFRLAWAFMRDMARQDRGDIVRLAAQRDCFREVLAEVDRAPRLVDARLCARQALHAPLEGIEDVDHG